MKRQYWQANSTPEAVNGGQKKNRYEARKKKREVYSLENDCDAWNIDGSSSDLPPQCSSWIAFWESKTGLKQEICSYSDCNKPANVGGHIWLKRKGPHIAPICRGCNYIQNVKRLQGDDGVHSKFRKGTTLVKIKHTEAMKNADRRIATSQIDSDSEEDSCDDESESEEDSSHESSLESNGRDFGFQGQFGSHSQFGSLGMRLCVDCNRDISDRPMNHFKCLESFRGSRLPESEEESSDESDNEEDDSDDEESECEDFGFQGHFGSYSHYGNAASLRVCQDCNRDISERPMNHTKCLECFRGNRFLSAVVRDDYNPFSYYHRRCRNCSCDISDRPSNHTHCLQCWRMFR
ncbi:hypothetical protein CTEN210_12910 [Chaetoceros tenuissimus]|uniref:Uncharacterized protein n=1 Tax=Chaetoceros tenuissimus TaxID=426638 RepID=A0AAD3HAY2_9STRA|nr:hypothetical protein CTEN210_12910 [Chaetoceros tenuissimus]